MGNKKTESKKRRREQQRANKTKNRKTDFTISYSSISGEAAEERLGITLQELGRRHTIPVKAMLERSDSGISLEDIIKQVKEKVYDHIVDYIQFESYPTAGAVDFTEANVNDLVLYIMGPVLTAFKKETDRNIH
ncbi:hypothetical protein BGX38DRAFT_1270876 [Terfezia claveryi]|nr:hypothetical protein BGX38DRAFT_1270876 [Terfezia claveryi]